MKYTSKIITFFMGLFAFLFASMSQAAIDVSGATTVLSGDATTAVTSVGVALLSLAGVVVAFKFAKRALFG